MDNVKKEAKGFFIFFGDVPLLERLTDEERGQLLTALIEYAQCGRVPNYIDRYRQLVFETLAKKIDSYYNKQGLSRPSTAEVEPVDEELSISVDEFVEPKTTRRPVTEPPFRLEYANVP